MALAMYPQPVYDEMFDYDNTSMYTYESSSIKQEPMSDSCSDTSEVPTYTNLSPARYQSSTPKLTLFKEEQQDLSENFDELLSWTSKHPEHWSNREVLDWIYYVAEVKKFDGTKLYGERYQRITGQMLANMSLADFLAMDTLYGGIYYELFQSLLTKSRFTEPLPLDEVNPDTYPFLDTTFPCLPVPFGKPNEASSTHGDQDLSVCINSKGVTAVTIDGNVYDIDTAFDLDTKYQSNLETDWGYVSAGSEMSNSNSDVFSISDDDGIGDVHMHTLMYSSARTQQRRRQMSSTSSGEEERQVRRRPITSAKGNHLWEFIRDLLKDPKLNPSLLKWEDKDSGIFKFVQSEAVANMWGRKKNNPGMTYEKLSRAMRFCRTAGYFSDVPKNGKFPKKLCFRFGPKAHDWK